MGNAGSQVVLPSRGATAVMPSFSKDSVERAGRQAGTLAPAQEVEQDVITILMGNLKLLERFTELFRINARPALDAAAMLRRVVWRFELRWLTVQLRPWSTVAQAGSACLATQILGPRPSAAQESAYLPESEIAVSG
jgi:hypothetical protein